ncbi:MAG: hypothetical protein Q9214_002343 [Letrouitia sp. 1 TL-2023]
MSAMRAPFRLRSTCDACSAAKVKCDKKQPVCDRCRTNGFKCSYSPSRRHGKHSWKKFSEFGLTPPGIAPAPEPVMDVDSGDGQASSGTGDGSGGDDATFVDFNALGDGFEVNPNWTGLNLGIDLSNGFGPSDDVHVHDRTGTGTNSISPSVSNSIWDGPSSIPTTAASSVSEAPPTRTAPADCEAEAFTALHSLHLCTMLHADHPGESKQTATRTSTSFGGVTDRMPPLDKVLCFNRAAISTLKELLDAPCVQQPHLALLYMTIASKVLFWYRLVVSSQYQSKSGPRSPNSNSYNASNGQPSPLSTSSNTSDRAVRPVPFQIGVFDLEDEDQKLLMKGVLLREVRKLESVVDKMKRLGNEHTRDDEYHEEQHMSNWYAVAGSKMHAEVQDTLRQIKEFGAGVAR